MAVSSLMEPGAVKTPPGFAPFAKKVSESFMIFRPRFAASPPANSGDTPISGWKIGFIRSWMTSLAGAVMPSESCTPVRLSWPKR
ncbi:hypothetical protein D3C86_2048700 [compost metagenome]